MNQSNSQNTPNTPNNPSQPFATFDIPHETLTPPLTVMNHQGTQENPTPLQNNLDHLVTTPQAVPFANWTTNLSQRSITTEENRTDELFDKIERLIHDYMQQSRRHHLHCRVLRWNTEENPSRLFSAVIVINPPTEIPEY